MKKLLLAFQFLTIIPIKEIKVSEKEMGTSSAFFPVVGFMEGLGLVFAAQEISKILPLELTNGLLIVMIILINGGLHLDGLADTFDAIALRGDRGKKLAVMKDSTIGSIGAIAIVLVILLKYLLLNTLFLNSSRIIYYSSLFLMPVFSRWVMVPAIFHSKSAREDGLGKIFVENTGLKELVIATSLTVLIFLLVLLITHYSLLVTHFLCVLLLLYIFCLLSVWFCNKKFGGMTGDTFGALSEISGILFLLIGLIIEKYSLKSVF